MKSCYLIAGLVVVLAGLRCVGGSQASDLADPRPAAADAIDATLRGVADVDDPVQQLKLLKDVADATLRAVPTNVLVAEALQAPAQAPDTEPQQMIKLWQAAVIKARDLLRFKPLVEAPLPNGFPEPAPLGEIRVQHYPSYRLARTKMSLAERNAFMTLFNHIQQHEIAMTAPVETTYTVGASGQPNGETMAFLYRSTRQGEVGTEGNVEVLDVPAQSAVSLGMRGNPTKERIADARKQLEAWLQAHAAEYEAAGPLRVLGYNSPFVPAAKRLTEVQIPVKQAAPVR